jgi:opacity protein-like surface antigen
MTMKKTQQLPRALSFVVGSLLYAVIASSAQAQKPAEPAAETGDADAKSGLFLLGGKIGGIASLNGLDPFVHGAVELGYVFPALDQGLGALLQVEYSAPSTDGHVDEEFDPERVPSGGYDWNLLQKELVLAPTFLYRMTFLSESITPYAGLGLRVYLLENTVHGKAGDQTIDETHERSTKWGLGVPLGAEFALGPGGVTAELLFQWGPLEHTLTGDTHLGGVSLFVGYRLLL